MCAGQLLADAYGSRVTPPGLSEFRASSVCQEEAVKSKRHLTLSAALTYSGCDGSEKPKNFSMSHGRATGHTAWLEFGLKLTLMEEEISYLKGHSRSFSVFTEGLDLGRKLHAKMYSTRDQQGGSSGHMPPTQATCV